MSDNIIDFGSIAIKRKASQSHSCSHKNLSYDIHNETVRCDDCKEYISSFRAFMILVNHHGKAWARIQHKVEELNELARLKDARLLKATRAVEKAWRERKMVPDCPHCGVAIFPDDGFGTSMTNKEMALEQRKFKNRRPND